ncbi:hypothetical protein GCK72_006487 [Caenorhabditis remanei]|uniref:Sdz-33 F-box domain-containing protein n=1 Tax=Caenorhabditis remanei TaxID=31234 RepID=A0A6A5HF62_CAERE|nr:hypothetical protein GCK72_006487 [Caenorhabditis remanei]KAF1766530.1 hypothetical protein GCK72_006487 [Caenorhabditis remanei]
MRHTPTYTIFILDKPEKMSYGFVEKPEKEQILLSWTWKKIAMESENLDNRTRLKLKDVHLDCRVTFHRKLNIPTLVCRCEDVSSRKRFATALHSHMCEVFHVKPEMQFKLSLDYMDELPYTNTVRDVTFLQSSVNSTVADEFFEKFHVTRALFSKRCVPDRLLKHSCKFLEIKNLFVDWSPWLDITLLLKVKCENIVFQSSTLPKKDMIDLLNNWLEGNNTRLKAVSIFRSVANDAHLIMDNFNLEAWDPEVDKIEYDEPVHDYCEELLYFLYDIKKYMLRSGILRRQSDGSRALVRATYEQLHFLVLKN